MTILRFVAVGQYTSGEVIAVIALWLAAGAVVGFIRILIAEKYDARVHWTTTLVDVICGPYSIIGVIRAVSNFKALMREIDAEIRRQELTQINNWPPPKRD